MVAMMARKIYMNLVWKRQRSTRLGFPHMRDWLNQCFQIVLACFGVG